ncbi:MAG: NRDE family protein [Microbacterium sp.]
MCTAIVHVPAEPARPVRLLAVRDEDPQRAWQPLGAWWPATHPGVVGVRDALAGGAWIAADDETRRAAVLLNRRPVEQPDGREPRSRGHLVLDAVEGRSVAEPPPTNGFNLVAIGVDGARVTMWDGVSVRRVVLSPGIHMIAHDDVDDAATARIATWRDAFGEPGDGPDWWMPWLDTVERTNRFGPLDDRAIVRDNRPHGYPTLSLLVCAVSVSAEGVDALYGEFDRPGVWNRPDLRPPVVP